MNRFAVENIEMVCLVIMLRDINSALVKSSEMDIFAVMIHEVKCTVVVVYKIQINILAVKTIVMCISAVETKEK